MSPGGTPRNNTFLFCLALCQGAFWKKRPLQSSLPYLLLAVCNQSWCGCSEWCTTSYPLCSPEKSCRDRTENAEKTSCYPLLPFFSHRIMESQNCGMVWVGRDLKDHLVPTPCHGQGHLPPDQVAQSPSKPGLEHFQGGDIHSFSGQPGPVSSWIIN